ncbi:sulfatase [Roseiconus sp. JC912]|uniref:sulfatase family protein n=1 Tax=Roseiconus sp. JC912 TaxID=3396307 RepID=UPI003A4C6CCB
MSIGSSLSAQETKAVSRPNIVVIVADDLGYGETGMMGNREIPTPNIDSLADRGIRCTSGYVTSSYCSPSRAGLLTGRYQSRFGYDQNPTGARNLLPDSGLPLTETTFVEQLRNSGYKTGLVGKWHLGAVADLHPMQRGFESFYGFLHEGHFYVPGSVEHPDSFANVMTMVRDKSLDAGSVLQDGNFVRGNYAPINEPAYDQDNPILRGKDVIEESRYLTEAISDESVEFIKQNHESPFCLMVCYNAVHSPMQAPLEDCEALKRIEDVQRRIFAGMLVSMDRGIGQLLDAIDEHSLRRNTMIVFLSDNGGPTKELTSSNKPLAGGKGTLYEGGVRIPMVWSFPDRLPEGVVEQRPILSLDIAATALDVAGLPIPENVDGVSLMSWIDSPLAKGHETIFWRMQRGKKALRSGNWKVVSPGESQPFELYHLASDIGEERDLAAKQPEKLSELINRWQSFNRQMPPLK